LKDEASDFVAIFTDKYENAFSEFSLEQVGSLIWNLSLPINGVSAKFVPPSM
jgi:hypothetical protein